MRVTIGFHIPRSLGLPLTVYLPHHNPYRIRCPTKGLDALLEEFSLKSFLISCFDGTHSSKCSPNVPLGDKVASEGGRHEWEVVQEYRT